MRLQVIAAILAFSFAVQAAAQVTDAERASIEQAIHRGDLIYAYDQAAWHGTDDFREKAQDVMQHSGGWVVDGPADAPELVFFDQDADHPHALYVARFKNGVMASSSVLEDKDDRAISPTRLRMIAALRAARDAFYASKSPMCSRARPNTVVLPPDTPDGPTLVYFLEPQPSLASFSIGGNYRIEVGADGKAGAPHPFAKSCIALSNRPSGEKTTALVVTHLLDPVPTEIHVFAERALNLPIYVLTSQNDKIWVVEEGRIRWVDPSKFKK